MGLLMKARGALAVCLLYIIFGVALAATPLKPVEKPVEKQGAGPSAQAEAKPSSAEDLDKRVAALSESVKSLETQLRAAQEKLSAQLVTHTFQLVTYGVGAFGVAATLTSFLGNFWIKDRVTAMHEEAFESAKSSLDEKTREAIAEASATIFMQFGGHCINLYKDFKDPSHNNKNMYNSYVNIAVTMSKYGYLNAEIMRKSLELQKLTPNDTQKLVIEGCLNNYAYYLAQRASPHDKTELATLLPKVEKTVADEGDNPGWWDRRDTLAWVKLALGLASAADTHKAVTEILNSPLVPDAWKLEVIERYNFYDRFQEHIDKVKITEAKPHQAIGALLASTPPPTSPPPTSPPPTT